ncbi:MAG: hypothetical protein ACLUHA_11490 [Bacteroides stercoris]
MFNRIVFKISIRRDGGSAGRKRKKEESSRRLSAVSPVCPRGDCAHPSHAPPQYGRPAPLRSVRSVAFHGEDISLPRWTAG